MATHLHLPDYVVDSLVGWVQFGQGIAWKSFNVYRKVFALRSLTARYGEIWLDGLLGRTSFA